MSSRSTQRSKQTPQKPARNTPPARPPQAHEIVHPVWVAKMLGVMVVLALLCAQLLVCYVFYKTQWQYVLRPSHDVAADPSSRGLPFENVRFGVDATGQPQLGGWLIAASSPSAPTALLLHSGDGSMADALPAASALHQAGVNVLLFDYRGYGKSGGRHPSQETMQADTESALNYLTTTRGLAPKQIVLFGTGVGASLAVNLAQQHPELPALILLNAEGDLRDRVRHDRRVRVVPVSLLFNQDFPLAAPLASLATPKLLLTTTQTSAPPAFTHAHDPKTTVELTAGDAPAMTQALTRFLDEALPKPIPTLGK